MNTIVIKVVSKVLLLRTNGDLLLVRRSDTDSRRPLQWDFPGGMVDAEEYAEDAAVREVREESGLVITCSDLRWSYATSATFEADETKPQRSVTWLFFVATVTSDSVILSHEHDKFEWVKPDESLAMFEYPVHQTALKYILDNRLLV